MDHFVDKFYPKFLATIAFLNQRVERKYSSQRERQLYRIDILSADEFSCWWNHVSRDPELKSRWLERFENPRGSFEDACKRIKHQLDRISIRRIAA